MDIVVETNKARYERIHKTDPVGVIEVAVRTVGLDIHYVSTLIEKQFQDFEDLNSIKVSEWFYLCKLLHIDIDSLSYGYSPYFHQRAVGIAVYEGDYHLPMTEEVKAIWKSYKREFYQDRKNSLKRYGGKLKRKVRFDYLKSDMRFLLKRLRKNSPKKPPILEQESYHECPCS